MVRTLVECCERFCQGGNFKLALFDDNGNSCYSKGDFQVTNEDVACIRQLLKGHSINPYKIHVAGMGYLCFTSTDQILYGKGGFNELTQNISVQPSSSETAQVDVKLNRAQSDTDMHEPNADGVQIEAYVNRAFIEDTSENADEEIDVNVNEISRDVANAQENNRVGAKTKRISVSPEIGMSSPANDNVGNNGRLQGQSLNNGVSFTAMIVNDYIVMMQGPDDRNTSWLLTMKRFRDKITRYI